MHREEREFSIIVHAVAEFDDDYEGDADGFAWYERFDTCVRPKLVAAVFDALSSDPSFRVIAAPRGRDPDRAMEVDVIRVAEKG